MTAVNADGDDETAFDLLSPEEMVWVNLWCDRYEQKWREGETQLADFLQLVNPRHTQSAFRALCLELIAIDSQKRHRLNYECSPDYYQAQFSELNQQDITQVVNEATMDDAIEGIEPLTINQQLGDYGIKEHIASGGMGDVYRAEHRLMRRQVAIKLLSARSVNDVTLQRRFLREVRALAKLSHPNVISAFDARLEGELLYLVTEWIQGEDLSQRTARSGPLPCREALGYIRQAALGLQYAHSQGIIHRDVKPSNLLLDQHGTVKVLDLGLSRLLYDENENSSEAITQSMHLLGTVSYMSPEQARSPLSSDRRSDIYSLGCTLFYLLTGKPPFSGKTVVEIIYSHERDPIPNVPGAINSVDSETTRLLQSMLAKKPQDRPGSMEEVSQRLTQILDGTDSVTLSTPRDFPKSLAPSTPRKQLARRKLTIGKILGTILFVLAFAIWAKYSNHKKFRDQEEVTPAVAQIDANSGISMNGASSYGQIADFDIPLPDSVLIEASYTANRATTGPANLVMWTGPRNFGLFIDPENRWGVSFSDQESSSLYTSDEVALVGKQQLIAARYDSGSIALFIDGHEVPTNRRRYAMVAREATFCFGGMPDGLFPLDEGTRFLAGRLHRLRVSTGYLPIPSSSIHELVNQPGSTIALIQFSETEGKYALDESNQKRDIELHEMPSASRSSNFSESP